MKRFQALLLVPALAAVAVPVRANGILRSNTLVTNASSQVWQLEPGSVGASFTVAVNSESGPLVSTAQTVKADTRYLIEPGQTVLLRLQDARKSVHATFNLRDHRGQVAPTACLDYAFQSSSPGWFARCFPCCCTIEAPGPATLSIAMDDKLRTDCGLENASAQEVRITRDQWPEFPKTLSMDDLLKTVGPGL